MNTALHVAANTGRAECVRFILECGFAVNTKRSEGMSALHCAAEFGHTAAMLQLLVSGADIEAMDLRDSTPLMHAMAANEPDAVNLLVAGGAVLHVTACRLLFDLLGYYIRLIWFLYYYPFSLPVLL